MILRVVIYTLVALLIAVTGVTVVGYSLPVAHVASRDTVVPEPAEQVFARINDVARYPTWRRDLESVDVVSNTPLRWRERTGGDVITYEVVEASPPHRFVTRIADEDLPFGGTWTWELRREGPGTRVTITEHGEVYNPIFRFMSRFVLSQTATMETMLRQLREAASGSSR